MTSAIDRETLKRIGPIALQRYAVAHGWERKQLPEHFQIALYRRPENPRSELVLPQSQDFGDYYDRVEDFIINLAAFEGVSVRSILNTVLNPHTDTLRFGYQAPEAKLGYVPFLTGIGLFDAALRSISTATYDVVHPEKFHPRMSNPTAEAYIESCRMGQTEVGSFVISCICPVEPTSQLPVMVDGAGLTEEEPSFGRKVTRQVMKSVAQIREFVLADQVDRLVNPEPGDITISGNFFESLMAFPVENEDSSLYIEAKWDKAVSQPDAPSRADIRYDMFESIDDVSRQLRPAKVSREDRFIAKVVALKGDVNPQERMEGDVILLLLHMDAGVKARITLSADDYAIAGQAHMSNRYVSVTGIFSRFRKSNVIEQYTSFALMPE
ncbi:hypothetical protein [Silvibacterium sp.]|uniref:hypothetical protein n=1 Tax=Silvibacterium sp. TaxID=1964179 RepID=UPI0039E2EC5B